MIFLFLRNMPQFITSLTTTHFHASQKTFDQLKEILEPESECAIEWFNRNGKFVNHDKFKAFVIDKKEQTTQMKRYKPATKIFKMSNQLNC